MADKKLNFGQREGAIPLPEQLQPKQVSRELRARLWSVVHSSLLASRNHRGGEITGAWRTMMYDMHVEIFHAMSDDFDADFIQHEVKLRALYEKSEYIAIFTVTEWILGRPECPPALRVEVAKALEACRAAYRVVGGDTILPLTEGQEAVTLSVALTATSGPFQGSHQHLRNAARELRENQYAASIRESIHAVEAVLKVLDSKGGGFDKALARLEVKKAIHPQMKAGFAKLYNFASDEEGVRHSLGASSEAGVDELEAIYMIGSCSAFITFLVGKARNLGLVKE